MPFHGSSLKHYPVSDKKNYKNKMRLLLAIIAATMLLSNEASSKLVGQVENYHGSPTLFVNGAPVSPLMFFGHAVANMPTKVSLTTEWKEYCVTFVAPEDNQGRAGMHFRMGGPGQGTVWVDDVRFYPGPKTRDPELNWARQGDWEGSKEEIAKDWTLFQADYAGAQAEWDLDGSTCVRGKQSLRVEVKNGGRDRMHLHFHQTGLSVEKGKKYTYSLWMKADKPRTVDFMALRIGEPWTLYGGQNPHYAQQVQLAKPVGIHLYSFTMPMPWPRPGEKRDFSGVDKAIQLALEEDPEGLFLPRFGMGPPGWWLQEHPEERMLFEDGRTEGWSMASQLWIEEMEEHLRALVRYCEDHYQDHMLGYHPCGQHTGEWFYYRSWEPVLSDFSKAMDHGFSRWCQEKYCDREALRKAWNEGGLEFEEIRVPTAEEQRTTTLGFFRDPSLEAKVIDFFEYKQVAMERPLERMARVIKEETGGEKLVCLFYGYTFDMHGIPMGPQTSGHLAMGDIVRSPDVDILCSPISYGDRHLGGSGSFMVAVDTVRNAGKLWLNEDDTRTYLTPEEAGFGRVDTPQHTLWVHERNFAQLWPRRLACWYMDLPNQGWLNGADIWENIGVMHRYYQTRIQEPSLWHPEVAMIVDEQSPFYTQCSRSLHVPLVCQMRKECFRMGAPFGIYLLSDLVAGRVPESKVYLFSNAFHLDRKQRRVVRKATQGKTALWLYGAGYLKEDASARNVSRLTGIEMALGSPQPGQVFLSKASSALLAGLPDRMGNDTRLDPLFTVKDKEAEILGSYGDGSPGLALKLRKGGLSLYAGVLQCPAQLLRNLLKASDVHLYLDSDDVVLTDGEFLCVVACDAGRKTLSFPGTVDVFSAFSEELIATAINHLELDLQKGESRTYLLRP